MTHASGGHPPPLLWRRATGAMEELAGGGPLLERFGDARFESSTIAVEPGDRIVLYTDGLTEAPGAVLEDLERWTRKPSSERLDDDLTLLVVEIGSGW